MIYIGLAIDSYAWISIENEKITHLSPCKTLYSIICLDVNAQHLQSTPRYRYSRTWVIAGKWQNAVGNSETNHVNNSGEKTGSLSADFIKWSWNIVVKWARQIIRNLSMFDCMSANADMRVAWRCWLLGRFIERFDCGIFGSAPHTHNAVIFDVHPVEVHLIESIATDVLSPGHNALSITCTRIHTIGCHWTHSPTFLPQLTHDAVMQIKRQQTLQV